MHPYEQLGLLLSGWQLGLYSDRSVYIYPSSLGYSSTIDEEIVNAVLATCEVIREELIISTLRQGNKKKENGYGIGCQGENIWVHRLVYFRN